MTAYAISPEFPVVLHFPDDSADAVSRWVLKAVEEEQLHRFSVAGGSDFLVVNFGQVSNAMVSASEPPKGAPMTTELSLSELDPPGPAPATADMAVPRGRITRGRPSLF